MAVMKLTKALVEELQYAPDKTLIIYDSELTGFGIRISKSLKSYFAEARVNGKTRRVKINSHERGLSAEDARREAKKLIGKMGGVDGEDLNRKRREKREKERGAITLQKCFDDYLHARANLKPKSVLVYKDAFKNCFVGEKWADKPLQGISKADVSRLYRKIGDESPAYATLAMRLLRALYEFAAERYEGVSENPVSVISKTRSWYKIERRRTLVKPHDLPAFFDGLKKLDGVEDPRGAVAADYIRVLLFTGLRRNEAAGMKWKDVDFKAKTFTIPMTKNGQPHTLPMSEPLLKIFRRRQTAAGKNENVFSLENFDKPLADPRYGLELARKLSGVTFTYHDLRRSFASIAEAEVSAYQLKRMLNHSQAGDVTAGYIVSDAEGLRDGMERVARKILNFAEGKTGKLLELAKKGK
jgi:integrase